MDSTAVQLLLSSCFSRLSLLLGRCRPIACIKFDQVRYRISPDAPPALWRTSSNAVGRPDAHGSYFLQLHVLLVAYRPPAVVALWLRDAHIFASSTSWRRRRPLIRIAPGWTTLLRAAGARAQCMTEKEAENFACSLCLSASLKTNQVKCAMASPRVGRSPSPAADQQICFELSVVVAVSTSGGGAHPYPGGLNFSRALRSPWSSGLDY